MYDNNNNNNKRFTLAEAILSTLTSATERSFRCFYRRHHARCTGIWRCHEICWLRSIAVDSKSPPIFWYKPPDLLFPFPYTNNDAESHHSHLNAELYAKHPNIYLFVNLMYWKRFSRQRLFPWIACHNGAVTTGRKVSRPRTELWQCSLSLSVMRFHSLFHAFLYTFVVRFYTLLKCVIIIN